LLLPPLVSSHNFALLSAFSSFVAAAMLAKLVLQLGATAVRLGALAAAVSQHEHLTSPSVLGSRTAEALRKSHALGGMLTFDDSAGPAVLEPEEARGWLRARRPTRLAWSAS
jgi:hypothetical protein